MCAGQLAKSKIDKRSPSPVEHGIELARSGRCREALPILGRSVARASDQDTKLTALIATVRCAMAVDNRDAAADALKMLTREFPADPQALYVATHAYSDLATRVSADLAQKAPDSPQAHELNAEALEVQGKFDQATREYQWLLKHNPKEPGIHYRIGRLLLSKPDFTPEQAQQAREEFQHELEIDPTNAGAEYVLGVLARQSQQLDEAATHFSRAGKLDSGFADAFAALGETYIASKKFEDAISPLEIATKLQPQNATAHYNLALAYNRVGRKLDASREFGIHRQLTRETEGQVAQP